MPDQPRPDAISWDECFMQMARLIAKRSKDPVTQTGAVIVNDRQVVVGMGYNGWPRGIANDALPWGKDGRSADTKYAYIVHAEENAVYNTSLLPRGCRIYCTLFPCGECAKTLIQTGIVEVIYDEDKYHDRDLWVAARKMFDLAGVTYRHYDPKFRLNLERA
ncbi:MAG: dCMP deaminase family protein [Patescibacteria group bacterium]